MLILLPPSEGKSAPASGAPLRLADLCLPDLSPARERVLTALRGLCRTGDDVRAREVLGLSPGQSGEITRNAMLTSAPAAEAAEVYTGVLYDALALDTLPTPARVRADQSLLIFSGLWGVLRPDDRIPAYRCSIGVRLPDVGPLTAYWRAALRTVLPTVAGDGLVLDLRSGPYAAVWSPAGELATRTATVRVLHERVEDGVPRRTVVSHFNKATKGRLVRALLTAGAVPGSPEQVVTALRDLGYRVEPQPVRPRAPLRLDVVVAEL